MKRRWLQIINKRLITSCLPFVLLLFLQGCSNNHENTAEKEHENTTDPGPVLYSINEQKKILKPYHEFYDVSYLEDKNIKDNGTYPVPGLLTTRSLDLHQKNTIGTSESMDPQGVTIADDYILVSSYSHDEKYNSVIYMIDKETHKLINTVVLDGNPHVGGVTYDPNTKTVWVCSSSTIHHAQVIAISLDDMEEYDLSKDKKPVKYKQTLNLDGVKRASYITYENNALHVGYFDEYEDGILDTYKIGNEGNISQKKKKTRVLTKKGNKLLPEDSQKVKSEIQGVTFYDKYILLSRSYGDVNSDILIYEKKENGNYTDKDLVKKIKAPPYIEQITANEDSLYTIFESGSKRYRDKGKTPIVDHIIMLDLKKILQ